jgi:hypothetical protein
MHGSAFSVWRGGMMSVDDQKSRFPDDHIVQALRAAGEIFRILATAVPDLQAQARRHEAELRHIEARLDAIIVALGGET